MNKIRLILIASALMLSCSSDDSSGGLNNGNNGNNGNNNNNPPNGFTPCENGMADIYPCEGLDLLASLSLTDMSASAGNDIWGWFDAANNREYALVGLDNGTAFVDVTDTENLVYLGKLPTETSSSTWRDVKVYQDHAFIGSEAGGHGMQVFDLTRLRDVTNPPVTFDTDALYTEIGNSHNIVINETSGFAYPVGTNRSDAFNGGVHFVDISDPKNPTAAGGYGASGYTHDAQVVSYNGPDADYAGSEILIGANENFVVLVDVTDKASPAFISQVQYPNIGYTHQGWFTEDQRYFILGDELDESNLGFNSRTLVFDFTDLDNPVLHTTYSGPTTAIDHNGYVLGNLLYLANYTAGIRIIDLTDIDAGNLVEVASFDTFPDNDNAGFAGVWSVYPYLNSGKILVNDMNSGLFVLRSSN